MAELAASIIRLHVWSDWQAELCAQFSLAGAKMLHLTTAQLMMGSQLPIMAVMTVKILHC